MTTNNKEEIQTTEETTQEETENTFKVLSRKPFFNEIVTLTRVSTEITPYKAKLVLTTKEYGDITTKLKKEVMQESFNHETGMFNKVTVNEKVTQDNIKEILPTIILEVAKLVQMKKSIKINISFSKTIALVNGEEQTYTIMYPNDLETIYSPDIHKQDETNINRQIMRRDRNKKNI